MYDNNKKKINDEAFKCFKDKKKLFYEARGYSDFDTIKDENIKKIYCLKSQNIVRNEIYKIDEIKNNFYLFIIDYKDTYDRIFFFKERNKEKFQNIYIYGF